MGAAGSIATADSLTGRLEDRLFDLDSLWIQVKEPILRFVNRCVATTFGYGAPETCSQLGEVIVTAECLSAPLLRKCVPNAISDSCHTKIVVVK